MGEAEEWRTVYGFWFPPGLHEADLETHAQRFGWWFGGGSNPELPPFAPLVKAARASRLDHWLVAPL